MKVFLLVFDEAAALSFDVEALLSKLDEGASIYVFSNQSIFVKTALGLDDFFNLFEDEVGLSSCFATEITSSDHLGQMSSAFWTFAKNNHPEATAA